MQPLFQTEKIFASLVKELTNLINEDIIITNEKGVIVASTERNRIGNYHEGAYMAMNKREKMIMTQELSEKLKGVRKGIVLPIIIEGNPIGVLGITGDPVKIEPYGRIVQRMSELFIKETVDQITQEKMARNLELFIFDWIHDNVQKELLLERSEFFNIDIKKYSQIIILYVPFTTNHLSYKEILALRELWDFELEALFVRWGQGKLVIVDKEYNQTSLENKIQSFLSSAKAQLGREVYVGVGQSTGYMNLATSFEQAERACLIARKENKIVFEEQLQFEMIQYELEKNTKEKFIKRTISPILSNRTLFETLNSWLKNNMSIKKTSKDLHIHKNTLYYRLEKIEEITGLSFNRIDHIILFYIGSRFVEEFINIGVNTNNI